MSRIYLVKDSEFTLHLVRANTPQQAVAFVARQLLNVKVASQDELVEAISRGVEVESAIKVEVQE